MSKQHYQSSNYQPKNSIGYLVKRSHALLLDLMEPAVAAQGFTFIQYIVLAYLRDGIAINPKDFCSEFRHDSGALTRVLDQLAERGYLDRVRGVIDRRKVDLRLTDAGREKVESLIPTVVNKLNSALNEFSSAEVAELMRLLLKLNTSLQAQLEGVSSGEAPSPPTPSASPVRG